MAFDVYFRDDIAQGIVSIAVAMLSTAVAHGGTNMEYVRGVMDTSRAQALNYGIPWGSIMTDLQTALIENEKQEILELVAKTMR